MALFSLEAYQAIQLPIFIPDKKNSLVCLAILLFLPLSAQAKQKASSFILSTGVAANQVEASLQTPVEAAFEEDPENQEEANQKVALGGFPLGVDIPANQNERIETYYGGSLLLNVPNSQVSKTEIHGGALWNISGGPSLLANSYDAQKRSKLTRGWKHQTSLLLQAGLNQFSTSIAELCVKISGSTFEIKTGFRNRSQILGLNAIMQFAVSILSLPADKDRVSSQSMELLMPFPI